MDTAACEALHREAQTEPKTAGEPAPFPALEEGVGRDQLLQPNEQTAAITGQSKRM